ncbi:chloride channel protein [Paenibacillus sp. DLE-14]|uniref:Chloride channel protein n=2 Tax=Paenibacillus lignilyticus TaxID=1172615 RepID=A0ABS5CBD6_9BACL|nr:chloride channel protein [Paenibacillus lignilyticus]
MKMTKFRKSIRWMMYSAVIGIAVGSAAALFLAGLEYATYLQNSFYWLLLLLPVAGGGMSFLFAKYGANTAKGNNLLIEQIRRSDDQPDRYERVPIRMAPLILIGTWVTHLFGGSAGREGTAVQMGGSLADWFGRIAKVNIAGRRIFLLCGISAGFGAVFGTPWAGAVFALEVVIMGRKIAYHAILPCLIAAIVANYTTLAWGIHHIDYSMGSDIPSFSWVVLLKVLIASILFGWMSLIFTGAIHFVKRISSKLIPLGWLRAFVGGFVIIGLTFAVGTRHYLGLSLPLLIQSFQEQVPGAAFLWKTVFTVVTLGTGYLGGEVTPLFVIGAALGNALAPLLHLSVAFLAGLGLIAVFSGAANAPLACAVLGLELFGISGAGYMLLACFVSYMFSGHTGIYSSQLIGVTKPRYYIKVPGLSMLLAKRQKGRNARQ